MSGEAVEKASAHAGMRKRLKAFLPRRFLLPSRAAQPSTAPPIPRAETGDDSSHDAQSVKASGESENGIAQIWDEAWTSIQSQEPDLVARYQRYLLAQDGPDATLDTLQLSGKERREKLLRTADLMVTTAKAKLEADGSFNSTVKRVVEATVATLIKGTGIVAAIASTEPHAALVWTGLSAILPLLLNPRKEQTAALQGFADATRILCRFTLIESDLFNSSSTQSLSDSELVQLKNQLCTYLIQLYAMIIKLQIRLVLRYDRAGVTRIFRDVVQADDWEPLVKSIKELEEANFRDIRVIGQHVLLRVQAVIEQQGQQITVGFAEMSKRLQDLEQGIDNINLQNTAGKNNIEDSNCVNAFDTGINYVLQKDRNGICAPDTGQWLFHHLEYEAFQSIRGPQLLFVTAEAGGGKSTTMRTLIDKLQTSDEAPLIAYFFFKDDDERLRSYDEALSTLIYQLLVQKRDLVQHARGPYRQYGEAIRHHTKEMWQIILKIAAEAKNDIVCVLDAVDECAAPDRKQLVADLADAFHNTVQPTSRLRFIASSRPYQDEYHPYSDLVTSSNIRHLAGENSQVQSDIRRVIRFKAQELAAKRHLDQTIQDLLVERLCDQNIHTRSFLGVRMAFELLDSHHRMHKGARERTISLILADIPQQLGDQFDEMLSRSPDKEHAWRLFCVILAARRTLKIPEFKVIYSLTQPTCSTVGPAQSYDDLELPSDDDEFKRLVRSRCGLFITFVRNSVHLFHQTAKEHLMAKVEMSRKAPHAEPGRVWAWQNDMPNTKHVDCWKGCISKEDANLVCATVCMDILTFQLSQTWVFELFDSLNAGNSMFDDVNEFASERPFFSYAAFNWHEHVVLGGDSALQRISDAEYAAILDISKPTFWVWFLPLAEYINTSTERPKAVISSVWASDEESRRLSHEYGAFLREGCLEKLFSMGSKVHTLLSDTASLPTQLRAHADDSPRWLAEDGYHLIDAFYLSCGEYEWMSASQAVRAMERGDEERGAMLAADVPTPTLIWTCITDGAPNALRIALASVANLDWLHAVPEHIMYRRRKWKGWSSRTGKDLREERQKGWTKPWPPACVTIYLARTSATIASDDLFGALADWMEASPCAQDYAQQLWEAGGFLIPSLCRRLVQTGASIHSKMWKDHRNALQIAAAFREHDLIQVLLDLGADPASSSPNGYNALHWLFHAEEPFNDREAGMYKSSRQLRESQIGQPRYQKSRIAASVKALARTASAQVSVIDVPFRDGKTALMLAVRDSPTATMTLLDEGAEPDKRDDRGRTALMHFFTGGFNGRSISILKHLLHAGADSQASDSSGQTALGYWARHVTSQPMSMFYAGSNSYNKVFHALASLGALSQRDALVQEIKRLSVPLVVASRLGNAQLCWALLDTGVNPNQHGISATSPLGENEGSEAIDLEDLAWNPVMVALWANAYVTAAILLAYGADAGFQVPKRKRTKYNSHRIKKGGITPLHLAVGGADRGSWYGADIVLSTGGLSKGCAFGAATDPDFPVSTQSALERLAERERETYKASRAREEDVESSDSEYEFKKSVFANDSTSAEKVPFDSLFGATFSPQVPCDALLEAVISRLPTQVERQVGLAEYLTRSGGAASVNARTQQGITPLLAAVGQGRLDLARLLLQHGADPNMAAVGGCTPLMVAARDGQRDLVAALLAAGADADAQLDAPAPTECSCAAFLSWSHFTFCECHAPLTALVVAAERGHHGTVEALLAHGANPNLRIVHHAHGRLPSTREQRVDDDDDDDMPSSDSEAEQPERRRREAGFISVGTALTWARGRVRDLLLHHGADTAREEAIRRCDCPAIERRKEARPFGRDSDSDYATDEQSDSSTDWPWRRDASKIERVVDNDSDTSW